MGGGRTFFLPSTSDDPETGNNTQFGRTDGRDLIQVNALIYLRENRTTKKTSSQREHTNIL